MTSTLSRSTKVASHYPAFMGNCTTISHTCWPYLPRGVHLFVPGVTERNGDSG